jgi:hypothetical protein
VRTIDSYEDVPIKIPRFLRMYAGIAVSLILILLIIIPTTNPLLDFCGDMACPLIGFFMIFLADIVINRDEKIKEKRKNKNTQTATQPNNQEPQPNNSDIGKNPQLLIGAIQSIIYGSSITKVIELFSNKVNDNLTSSLKVNDNLTSSIPITINTFTPFLLQILQSKEFFIVLGFFATIIPFFHYSLIILTIGKEREQHRFVYFIILFSLFSSSLFYFIATNLNNPLQFTILLFILFLVTTIYIAIEYKILPLIKRETQNIIKNSEITKETFRLNLFQLNLITTFFLLYFVISNFTNYKIDTGLNNIDFNIVFFLFIVLMFRTIFDYVFGWIQFYTKYI